MTVTADRAESPVPAEHEHCVLLKYGELALKGRNKGRFERRLVDNLRGGLADLGGPVRVRRRRGVLVVSTPRPELRGELLRRVRRLIGISVVQPALRVPRTLDAVTEATLALAREQPRGARGFAIRARRRSKDFPLTSEQLAVHLGASVQREFGWPVDLSEPAVEIAVEVDAHEVFVSAERHRGQQGLPVGVSGRALVLLSGGFDSPVAAYRAMRRGLRCEFVHFTGAPLTGPSSAYKAYALVRRLADFQGGAKLHLIPLGNAQRALATAGAGELQVVAQRRLMVRTADRLAERLGAHALVTGDSLGQVSSQTLPNLTAVESAATRPVLRPLLAWDKSEIMDEAARIGTADISRLPDEDCCTLLVPPHVTTRAPLGRLARLEGRLDVEETVARLLAGVRVLRPGPDGDDRPGDRAPAPVAG